MQRILDPAQIEAFAQRAIPRIRLPDRAAVFSRRARRLRQLGEQQAIGHSIGDYLRLMASVADAQDRSLASIEVTVPSAAQLSQARAHRMPLLHAAGWPRDRRWLGVLPELCDPIAGLTEFPASVRGVCGMMPVASVVRVDKHSQGYRYLHCALCATEWHMVRLTCSQCLATQDISYHSIEGGSDAIRAESCGSCRTYRKILYQEKDTGVEPVADDLASLALGLLLGEAGYHRASGNPLLWQNPPEPV